MKLSDIEIMPYPNAIFYLTGVSLMTLVYVTYSNSINKIPVVVGQQADSVSSSISSFGAAISKSANDLYAKISPAAKPAVAPVPAPAPAPAPAAESAQPGIMGSISNSLSRLNPFGSAPAPAPAPAQPNQPISGGSKKKHKKRAKKTRRSKK
jgi:hypothetical protein